MKKRIINLVIFIISIFLITGCNNKSNKLKSIDDYVNDDNISFVYNALDTVVLCIYEFPGGSDGKASAYNVGDPGSIPGLGKSSGEGNGKKLHYFCLENPMDGGT